ncbi:hypothetical protein BGZ95_008832 [Linnemannia exigua]|uniref:Late embryogenesis abundant protein LEA-2 subgroup domain-containing protein n=1 Tax=Linnemannia exigua TaxID=604196 RepID=A0AAD4DDM0_9FUNG|nr:hypothetical protein BGZ95_008832 [Linnemannia exigua]
MTPTTGAGLAISPRSEHSASFPSLPKPVSTAGGLFPYGKGQRGSITRRMPSNEHSLYDPYRSRQPGMSANRVKNEYQAQSPKRDSPATFPQHPQPYYSGHGSNEELHNLHIQLLDGGALTDEQAFAMMHPPPSIGQREDHYRHSPTLVASQTLAATYTGRPESPFQPYLPYQPYSNQQQLPSPTIADAYRSSGSISSPGLGPYLSHYGVHEERSEYKADPYRSAYSQSVSNNNNSGAAAATAAASHHSPYLGSGKGSPNMHDDFSSSFESRLSGLSSQPNSSNSLRYPMRDLAGQDSNQALSASYYEQGRKQQQQQPKKAIGTATSSENGAVQSDPDLPTAVSSPSGHHTRQSTNHHPSQPSKTDSSGTKKAKTVEEDEDEVILQKLGVLSVGSSASRSGGTRSGLTQASGRSRRKGQWTSDSEEEGRAKAGAKRRRGGGLARRRDTEGRCCCCTTRVCIIITLSILVCLGLTLFFAIPRTPVFTFESVSSNGPVNATKDGIEELFHIHLQVDSTANYMPIRLNRLDLTVRLQSEGAKIADNVNMSSNFIIQPRAAKVVAIPMKLQYRTSKKGNGPDMILDDLTEACRQIPQSPITGLPRPHDSQPLGFDVIVDGKLNVWGLSWVWRPEFTFSVEDVPCPINAANQPVGGGNLPPSSSSGVVTVPPATVFVADITTDTPTATVDPSLSTTAHANVVAGKTASAASLSSPTPTF